MENWKELIPGRIAEKYEFHNFNSALEILTQSYPEEFQDLVDTLEQFEIDLEDILEKGGNESHIPKKLNELLRPLGWKEIEISGELIVRLFEGKKRKEIYREFSLTEFISGSESMNQIFSSMGSEIKKKYGASTTWMGKLLPRIHARRHGGCPLLVVGLTPDTVSGRKDVASCR